MRRLTLATFVLPGNWGHFARSRLDQAPPRLHTHDFHEVFWIEGGRGTMHTPADPLPLAAGDLVLVHADDRHGFSGMPGSPLHLVNLAFPVAGWREITARYRLGGDPITRPLASRCRHLGADGLGALRMACADLDHGLRDRLAVERVLLTVLGLLRETPRTVAMPAWLADGCRAVQDGRWRAGTQALVTASGRSREHVARVCREVLGKSPTELVTELRLGHLARRLVESDAPITDLAAETGLTNLAHVYRLFRRAYGVSPGAWRQRQQEVVRPGG